MRTVGLSMTQDSMNLKVRHPQAINVILKSIVRKSVVHASATLDTPCALNRIWGQGGLEVDG